MGCVNDDPNQLARGFVVVGIDHNRFLDRRLSGRLQHHFHTSA